MDVISFSEAATANSRIEIINANPDSSSGIVTVPKTIASGETVTIPAGRVAVLPNVQIDGVLNVEGEVFIPSGATLGDLDAQLALKADTSYVNAQLVLKQNVLVANDAGVKTALNASGAAPIYACRAWVNFNGTGTVAIRASGNVSSITDNGTGQYTVNFINSMEDGDYSIQGTALDNNSAANPDPRFVLVGFRSTSLYSKTVNSVRISTTLLGSAATDSVVYDAHNISISIMRCFTLKINC